MICKSECQLAPNVCSSHTDTEKREKINRLLTTVIVLRTEVSLEGITGTFCKTYNIHL